jgi:hypothetical protein
MVSTHGSHSPAGKSNMLTEDFCSVRLATQ